MKAVYKKKKCDLVLWWFLLFTAISSSTLYLFPRAVITNSYKMGGLGQQKFNSHTVLDGEVWNQGVYQALLHP
jgi:hypothetical protein